MCKMRSEVRGEIGIARPNASLMVALQEKAQESRWPFESPIERQRCKERPQDAD